MLFDALTLDAPRRTAAGYLAVRARASKTGVYQYSGREVDPDNAHGLRDRAFVNVLRDEATVFDESAVRTFIGKPITIDHPSVAVTAQNWKDHARGTVMGALRDGDHLAFDLLLMDAAAIADVEAGKVQVSNGYNAELAFGDFTAPDGTKCEARQARISDGNHVAIVDRARGGDSCRLGDAASCSTLPSNILDSLTNGESTVTTKTITFDGLPLLVTDAAEAAIGRLQGQITDANGIITARDASIVERDATIVARDADIARLTAELADANDPAKRALREAALRDATAKAKALGVTVSDALVIGDVHKALVTAKMPDKAATYDATSFAIAFDSLTVGVKVADASATVQQLGAPIITDAASKAEAAWRTEDHNAWRRPAAN